MADAVEFIIGLKDQLSPVASREAAALRQLDAQLRQAAASLKDLEGKEAGAAAALKRLSAGQGGAVDIAAAKAAQGRLGALAAQRAAQEKNLQQLKEFRPELAKQAKSAEDAAARNKAFGAGLAAVGGPAQGIAQRLSDLREAMGSGAGAAGLAAGAAGILAVALLALSAAALVAYGSLLSFAFGAAAAARNAKILGEALTGSAALGTEFNAVVNQLAREVPLAKDKIAELAKELSLMRLARRDLQAGLTSVAIVTSVLGDAAGSAVKSIVSSSTAIRRFTLGARDMFGEFTALAGTGLKKVDILGPLAKQLGVSVAEAERMLLQGRVKLSDGLKALEAATRARFGKALAAQMLDFNVQIQKAKESLSGMFSGVDIEPALNGLKEFLSVLDTSTVTGKALRTLLTAGLGDIAKALEKAGPLGKRVFQGMLIAALQLYILLKPIVSDIMGVAAAVASVIPGLTALNVGKAIIYGLAIAFGVVAVSIAFALLPLALIVVAIYALGVAVAYIWGLIVSAFNAIKGVITGAIASISEISLADAAGNIVDSFVTGLTAAGSRAVAAVANLAGNIASTFTGALKIGSPSKLFMDYGAFTAEGYTLGLEGGQAEAQTAAQGLVPEPTMNVTAARGGGGGGPLVVVNGNVTIDGRDGRSEFEAWMIDLFRKATAGGAAEAET